MSVENLSIGMSGASRFSGQRGRTGDGLARGGIRYPSPFFDIGHTYLPTSVKSLLKWCRYYYMVNPLINSTVHKMSEYPITETVIEEQNDKIKKKWEDLLKILRWRAFQVEVGLDYYTYGLCATSIHFPFVKYLVCRGCKHPHRASKTRYKWRNLDYVVACTKCNHVGPTKVLDWYVKDVKKIRLQRWNPEYLHVDPGFGGADPIYTFEPPLQLKNDILLGKKNVLDTIPDVFIEAIKRGKTIRFSPENLFVFKRPIISQKDDGWGMPLLLPVLKDVFYLQILRKAQEAIAAEHIVPLRVLFPQANSATSDPYTTINLDNWKGRIEAEIAKWKYDNNYIPILPLPIGNQVLGGDGKALGLHQEMEAWSRQIVAGMGVPWEFIFGGLSYSGSNVSMRMLENGLIGYRLDHDNMLNNFVIKRIAHFMGWPSVKASMRKFKMADDLQRNAFLLQLNQAQKISDRTLLSECDQDYQSEEPQKEFELDRSMAFNKKQQIAMASTQGETMVIQARYQNQIMQEQQALGLGQPPAGDPSAAGAGGGMPGAPGSTGAEGEMVPGQSVDPGMPDGSTVSMENAQQAPEEGVPLAAQSPITAGTKGGGQNLLYLAKRAAADLKKQDPLTQAQQLEKMKGSSPQLYSIVIQMLQEEKGSQADPLNPAQSPLPQAKPSRRQAPVGT